MPVTTNLMVATPFRYIDAVL